MPELECVGCKVRPLAASCHSASAEMISKPILAGFGEIPAHPKEIQQAITRRRNVCREKGMRAMSVTERVSQPNDVALLSLNNDAFRSCFDRRPFKIKHNLVDHPLLQLPRLVRLAQSISSPILYFRGDQSINQVDDASVNKRSKRTFIDRDLQRPSLSVTDTIAQIENANAWMQLRDIGADPEYARLLAQHRRISRARGTSRAGVA